MQGSAVSNSVCFLLAVVKFGEESTLKEFDHYDYGCVFGETHITVTVTSQWYLFPRDMSSPEDISLAGAYH